MTEYSLEVMGHIDPLLVEEIDLTQSKKRRMILNLRAAVAAACLCLVLVGTGIAAVSAGWIRVTDSFYYPNTSVNGNMSAYARVEIDSDGQVYIPLEQFSQEVQDFPKSVTFFPQYKGFDTWDEMEQYMGLNIADNPVLAQMEAASRSLRDDYGLRVENAKYILGFSGQFDAPTIRLSSGYQFHDEFGFTARMLMLDVTISTQPRANSAAPSGHTFRDTDEPMTETYTTPSGLQAVISTAHELESGNLVCQTSFQLHGGYWSLYILDFDNPDDVVPLVKEILDAYS